MPAGQQIRFCEAPDGVRIAYAVHGSGPPLLVSTCWLSHLQHDWDSPVWRHFLEDLGSFATVIRYDERGHGLSDWDVEDHSLEARVGDLEAVADDAGFERFALMAMSQGGPPAIAYTVRHPERVTRLLFYSSYAAALPDPTPEELELFHTFEQMIKVGFGRKDSAFRRVFTSLMIPGATEEQMSWLDELQRVSVSATTAYLARQQRAQANCIPLLAELDLPTLVLHGLEDQMNEFEMGRLLATHIDGARLVPLESRNHILLADEPAWPVFVAEVRGFLGRDEDLTGGDEGVALLSTREREVLGLAADGCGNEEIAAALHLSVRTVERHLHNVYAKLGVSGRSARAAAVARLART
ncbi:alpha/beta fold hydrolase [Nocardioides sp.]|uniref:alpha/beta fold hydrolase n=1 Tax=Nocardioides sp. TaxID=35761 RepID=UPI0025E498A8|nr:alpha/beta fold hydrolase [Nocardioides sp.]